LDKEDGFRVFEDVLGAAPELGILGIFGFVMYSNFATGSTTTTGGPGPNPIIGIKNYGTTSAGAIGGLLSGIEAGIQAGNSQSVSLLLSAISPLANTASSDVQNAISTLRNWDNSAQKDIDGAFSSLWSWVSTL